MMFIFIFINAYIYHVHAYQHPTHDREYFKRDWPPTLLQPRHISFESPSGLGKELITSIGAPSGLAISLGNPRSLSFTSLPASRAPDTQLKDYLVTAPPLGKYNTIIGIGCEFIWVAFFIRD